MRLRIVQRELDDASDLLVVDAVDDGDDRNDLDAGLVHVLDGLQLHVEQVADLAMRVGRVADSVELQIGVAQARFGRLLGELETLGEFDSVGRRLHRVVANLAGVADGIQEVGRKRRLATGELHRHLAARLDGDGVVQHRLDVFPAQLVDEADLVGVHEAGIAHHVAAIGQVDGQHRAASVLHGAKNRDGAASRRCGRECRGRGRLLPDGVRSRCRSTSRLRSGRGWRSLSPSGSCRRARRFRP